jgi:V8-like Glu-specific endopeptidase
MRAPHPLAWSIAMLIASPAASFAQVQQTPLAPAAVQGVVGVRLDAPDLKGLQTIKEAEIKSEVTEKTIEATEGMKFNTLFPDAMGTDAWMAREVVLSGVPIGYGSLLKTVSAVDPGPQATGADSRVIDLSKQPRSEAIVTQNNFLPVRFLEAGLIISKAVARVAIQFAELPTAGVATGFMVSPTLFMTNNHVIGDRDFATKLEVQFNYQYSLDGGNIMTPTKYDLDPDSYFYTSPELDFTLVRVKPRPVVPQSPGGTAGEIKAGDEFGRITLTTKFFYSVGQLANVVQHPQGRPKEIALHENKVDTIYANVLRYTTDTEPGSSGSPVFNNQWTLIALHHAAGEPDKAGKFIDNEGIRIDRIIEHLKKPATKIPADILKELGI